MGLESLKNMNKQFHFHLRIPLPSSIELSTTSKQILVFQVFTKRFTQSKSKHMHTSFKASTPPFVLSSFVPLPEGTPAEERLRQMLVRRRLANEAIHLFLHLQRLLRLCVLIAIPVACDRKVQTREFVHHAPHDNHRLLRELLLLQVALSVERRRPRDRGRDR